MTVLRRDDHGRIIARDSYEGERSRKRGTRRMRPFERGVRELVEFQIRVLDGYLGRHNRSNEKKRDGWLGDMATNVARSVKKAKPRKLLRLVRSDRNRD